VLYISELIAKIGSNSGLGGQVQKHHDCVISRCITLIRIITLCSVLSVLNLYYASAAPARTSKLSRITHSSNDIVTVSSPSNGALLTSGFTVNATSQPSIAGATIQGMILWLDGVQYGPIIQGNTLSVQVTTAAAAHTFGVSAWDTSGATGFSPTYSITVEASPTQPPSSTTGTSPSQPPSSTSGTSQSSTSSVSYYVAPSGDDSNPGTLSAPWLTIQHAMNNATPGSTVNIQGGTYHERLSLNVSGTAGNYITFQPYGFNIPNGGCGGYTGVTCGGDQVVLDYSYLGTVTDGIPLVQISAQDYVRIQGLTFQNLTCNGAMQQGVRIDSNSSYIEFNYNRFLNDKNIYPYSDGAAALLLFRIWPSKFVTVNSNEFGNIHTVMSEVLSVGDGATNTLFENNYIHDTDGIAISSWNGANNFSFIGNKTEYIGIRRDGSVWYNNPAVAIYSDGGYAGTIKGNIVSHAGTGYEALSEPGQPDTHDITISDNIAEHCISAGIVIGTWYSSVSGSTIYNLNVFNNTFYNNQVGVAILPMTSATVTWENNIFANNQVNYYNSLNWNPGNSGYNLYFGSNVGPGSNNVTSDPQFSNAAEGNFSLLSTSAAINAGDPNTAQSVVGLLDVAENPRIQGGRIDIGAHETR
jgi:hypothetical protein